MVTELSGLLDEDILSLGMRADDARRSVARAAVVRYQRVHVVSFGEFHQTSQVPDAASELRLIGTPAGLAETLQIVERGRRAAGTRRLSAFSLADLLARCSSGWGELADIARQLSEAGLSDLAEIPADLLPNLSHTVKAVRANGLPARRVTAANPLRDAKIEVLERIGQCIEEAGPFERVAPLPRNIQADKPTTGYEDLRVVALARLAFNSVVSPAPLFIEVDWTLYGPKLAQVALTFGADFLDAVAATSDDSLGPRRGTIEEVERNIRAAGFEPMEFRPPLTDAQEATTKAEGPG